MPDGHIASRPYALLVRAMRETKKHAFATVFFAGSDRLMLIRPLGKVLVMSELCYAQGVKDHSEFEGDVPDVDLPANELKLAKTLVDAMTGEVDLTEYRDKYSDDLRALVDAKMNGKEIVAVEEAPETEPRVINLMQALEESLKAATQKKPKKPPKLVAPSPAAAAGKARKRKTS
jgi:DNA end-binding protein Ku